MATHTNWVGGNLSCEFIIWRLNTIRQALSIEHLKCYKTSDKNSSKVQAFILMWIFFWLA